MIGPIIITASLKKRKINSEAENMIDLSYLDDIGNFNLHVILIQTKTTDCFFFFCCVRVEGINICIKNLNDGVYNYIT